MEMLQVSVYHMQCKNSLALSFPAAGKLLVDVKFVVDWPATLPVQTVTTLWTHTDSAIFPFFSTLCSTTQPWIWLSGISNLSTKNLEFIAC